MSYLLTRQEKQKEVTVQASIGVVGDHRTKEAAVVVVSFFGLFTGEEKVFEGW